MNLLDFPNEILFEFYRHMDFQSRVSFRKVCRRTNQMLTNPGDYIIKEKIDEWKEKMSSLLGMCLLDAMDYCVLLISPSCRQNFIRFCVDEKSEFYMVINFNAVDFSRKIILHPGSKYKITADEDMTVFDNVYYTKYKLEHHKNIFDHTENIGEFLYNVYMSFICHEQKKNEKAVSNRQISDAIKILMDNPSFFQDELVRIFNNSRYLRFIGENSSHLFKDKIEKLGDDLRKDLLKNFVDGDEAKQFVYSFYK